MSFFSFIMLDEKSMLFAFLDCVFVVKVCPKATPKKTRQMHHC